MSEGNKKRLTYEESLKTVEDTDENLKTYLNNSNYIQYDKIFTIGKDVNRVSSYSNSSSRNELSENGSEATIRPQSGSEKRCILPGNCSPSVYLTPRKTNSTNDLKTHKTGIKKNDNMVLNLVLPPSPSYSNYENTLSSPVSYNEMFGENNQKKHTNSHQEYPVYFNIGNINQCYTPSDTMEQGVLAIPNQSSLNLKLDNPSPPEEKKKAFLNILGNTFSILHALFIVTVGLAAYITELIYGPFQIAKIFNLVLVAIACAFLIYLIIDISMFMNKKRAYEDLVENNLPDNIDITETIDGQFQFIIELPQDVKMGKYITHDYCFNKDRHSTNFYLKTGAAAFCFGHLIHNGLILSYQIIFLSLKEEDYSKCSSITTLVHDAVYPIYSFILLYFIFKYSNVIINKNVAIARFGIIHCLSSSLCFWVWTIIREVLEAIAYKSNNTELVNEDEYYTVPLLVKKGSLLINKSQEIKHFSIVCVYKNEQMEDIYRNFSPYLYPFSVEYSILVVGILFFVWRNINHCNTDNENLKTPLCKIPLPKSPDNTESNVVVHADCQSSNKGLFGGFFILTLTIISTILYFYTAYGDKGSAKIAGNVIHSHFFICIVSIMAIACILGYRLITKLDVNYADHNLLDDVLLFICIPAFILIGIFSIIPDIIDVNVLGIFTTLLEIVQVLLQTAFLLDGLMRSSNTKKLRKLKPGKELVTFLIIANVALWLFQTFEVHADNDRKYEFYGKEFWTILKQLCLPLTMFYRFHSSVCFCHIWKYAYEPSGQ